MSRSTRLWCVLGIAGLASLGAKQLTAAEGRRVSFTLRHAVTPQKSAGGFRLTVQVPRDVPGQQDVLSLRYSHKPLLEFEEGGDHYVTFSFDVLEKAIDVDVDVDVELYRYDLETAKNGGKRSLDSPEALARFRAPEKWLESDSPEVQELIKTIKGINEEERLRAIMGAVQRLLDATGYNPGEVGALEALKKKGGDCTEFSDVFVTLCRAHGIAARCCEGFVTTPVAEGDTQKHAWAEFYHKEYGWVPLDPMWIESRSSEYDKRAPVYILVSRHRNKPKLNNGHFSAWSWSSGAPDVKDSYIIHSQTDLAETKP